MSPSRPPSSAAGDPSPDAIRRYLAETSRRELDALRQVLERKLVALETALANPGQHDSLEHLVIDLARAASAEAVSAAERQLLDAQVKANERAVAGDDETRRALEADRKANADLQRELASVKAALDEQRQARAVQEREVQEARRELAELRRAADTRAAAAETGQSGVARLERRCAELESARAEATARADAVTRQRDQLAMEHGGLVRARETLAAERDAARKDAEQAQAAAAEKLGAIEAERAALQQKLKSVEGERATLQQSLKDGEAERAKTAERERADAEKALKAAEARAMQAERDLAALTAERDAVRQSGDAAQIALSDKLKAAEMRATQAERDLAALTAERDAARQSGGAAQTALTEKLKAAETDRDQLRERLSAAEREHAALPSALADADVRVASHMELAQRAEAADDRIRALEAQLAEKGTPPPEDIDMGSLIDSAPAPATPPVRRANRYTFSQEIVVRIDGKESGALVDLSISGAQVLGPKALRQGRQATILLVSEEIPVTCKGTIVWSRLDPHSKNRPLRYRAGILFSEPDQGSLEAFIIRYATT
jgi:chromosome segregation ATPase